MSDSKRGEMSAGDSTAVVWIAQTMVEEQIAEAALREAGIPCIVEEFSAAPYDGIWVPQRGWGKILVSENDVERSREIIELALEPITSRGEDAGQEEESPDGSDKKFGEADRGGGSVSGS